MKCSVDKGVSAMVCVKIKIHRRYTDTLQGDLISTVILRNEEYRLKFILAFRAVIPYSSLNDFE